MLLLDLGSRCASTQPQALRLAKTNGICRNSCSEVLFSSSGLLLPPIPRQRNANRQIEPNIRIISIADVALLMPVQVEFHHLIDTNKDKDIQNSSLRLFSSSILSGFVFREIPQVAAHPGEEYVSIRWPPARIRTSQLWQIKPPRVFKKRCRVRISS